LQLAADIIGTAMAPTWEEIGMLAAIAVIRTGLNFFLGRELQEEEAAQERDAAREQATPELKEARAVALG
jgi:hypothetical protein